MKYTLIVGTHDSPYARKVERVLVEKGIPFILQTEVPWDADTETPEFNPLGKLPVLISIDTRRAVYESHFILEWLEAKHPDPPMLPEDEDAKLFAKQVQVVTDGPFSSDDLENKADRCYAGMCAALELTIWETLRDEGKQSEAWVARQARKIDGGFRQLADWVSQSSNSHFLIGQSLTLADIAICSVLSFVSVRFPDHPWKIQYPDLERYWAGVGSCYEPLR